MGLTTVIVNWDESRGRTGAGLDMVYEHPGWPTHRIISRSVLDNCTVSTTVHHRRSRMVEQLSAVTRVTFVTCSAKQRASGVRCAVPRCAPGAGVAAVVRG